MKIPAKPSIVIIGGGYAGLESAYYLRMRLKDQANITLISDRDYILNKPNMIYIPFGLDPQTLQTPLAEPLKRRQIDFREAFVQEIDPVRQLIHLLGDDVSYDYLIVATGAGMRIGEIPGLAKHAMTIWTPGEMLELRIAIDGLLKKTEKQRRVLFLIPPNNQYSGPIYELAFMLETWLHRHKFRHKVKIDVTTFEEQFLQDLGPRVHQRMLFEFERRGIIGHVRHIPDRIEKAQVVYKNERTLPYDLLVAFPPYVASTAFSGLTTDDRGFIQTHIRTRQVIGYPNIYAVGDASDFPVKQGFLALLQADAAAEHLAARIMGTKPIINFDPVGLSVMEEFDTATFLQVPFSITELSTNSLEIKAEMSDLYKVSTSPLWRWGKKALGAYLPWRFRNGEPFYSGIQWKSMDAGLKILARTVVDEC